ncbi:MAG: phospho-2-dehydro-3-deoxyheptonate aldolase, partial [Odoribacter sp.]|nr:phospho-2-dehydro-3-deoxyheptonate aldolase [Odoribacter sp.]
MFLWNEKAIQIVAGPCSVESEEQLFATARGLKKIGIQTLRGGIWKPRSRAHHFEGVGE